MISQDNTNEDETSADLSCRRVLLIMAKPPIPGLSKTRLRPALNDQQASDLSACFIQDTIDQARRLTHQVSDLTIKIAGSTPEAESYFAEIAPDVGFIAQEGADLSERLDSVIERSLSEGWSQVVAINSDSPTLPDELLSQCFHLLNQPETDVVIGPAEDGGYYLIGCNRYHPRLIRDVKMSTPDVLADTLKVALADGLRVSLLPQWYDVDEPEDLWHLLSDIESGQRCGSQTAAFLQTQPFLGGRPK